MSRDRLLLAALFPREIRNLIARITQANHLRRSQDNGWLVAGLTRFRYAAPSARTIRSLLGVPRNIARDLRPPSHYTEVFATGSDPLQARAVILRPNDPLTLKVPRNITQDLRPPSHYTED